jgi:FKBP-type peptidyl-prolyl cis-trans isomerase FklB
MEMVKMNLKWMVVCGVILLTNQVQAEEITVLKTDKEKLSYGIGVSVAKNFKKQGTDVDLEIFNKGLNSALAGERLLLSEKELRKIMNSYQVDIRKNALLSKRLALEDNKKKGEAFLAENKTKTGVIALPSGVQYKILKAGNGKKPIESDLVKVLYRGTLLDGTEFDATEPDRPVDLKVSALIVGWKEAVTLMPAGSKWQIVIPSQLAYGERGVGNDIEPNETLVFEVELLEIK